MPYLIAVYFGIGVLAAYWCVRYSERNGVESTFTLAGISQIAHDLASSPFAAVAVLPFALVCWPVLCMMDIMEVPKKRRAKKIQLAEAKSRQATNESGCKTEGESPVMLGRIGVTVGVLSPMGKVRIGDSIHEATAGSEYIGAGQTVLVIGQRANLLDVAVAAADHDFKY